MLPCVLGWMAARTAHDLFSHCCLPSQELYVRTVSRTLGYPYEGLHCIRFDPRLSATIFLQEFGYLCIHVCRLPRDK
jgi:hypothetical protein